ncbi:MAG TPA: acyltransferase [Terriglobales bacterium]|nr:acyltransferase [Terriglobales bacterium]
MLPSLPLPDADRPASSVSSARIPALDGVRGWAILAVMFHNSGHLQRIFANGWMGVDLFFVLSGFLITGILVDTKQSQHYFKNFYVRRCLRIWPLYYSLLLFMAVAVTFLPSPSRALLEKSSPWWAYPLFLQNFLIAIPTLGVGPLGVTWSLAIEEQFYLLWALVVRYCSLPQIRRIAIAVICLSPPLRWFLSFHNVNLYTNLFCRLDGLMAGAALALVVRGEDFVPSRYLKTAWILLFMATPLAFALASSHAEWVLYSASAAVSVLFVYVVLFSRQRLLQRIMTNRLIVYTGTISYGLYLLHKLPFDVAKATDRDGKPLLLLLLSIVASYALAALSWNLLEKPFLRLKRFFPYEPSYENGAGRELPRAS